MILQSDSFLAKNKNGCRPRRAFLVSNVLVSVSTLLMVIFLVLAWWLGEETVSTGDT